MTHKVSVADVGYSPDVEISEVGHVVAARDLVEGEAISIPMHMLSRIHAQTAAVIYRATGEPPA